MNNAPGNWKTATEQLVSIVIPAYNHADFLADAIDSVITQDFPLELIVIDDGSTDGTSGILEKYTGRIYWETQQNMGQAATLNKGWHIAKGEILGYLSADDVLEPQAVKKAVVALIANPRAVAVYPDFNLIDPHSAVVRTVRAPDFHFRNALLGNECLPGPGALFRRDAFLLSGGWNPLYRQMPDYDFWLRLGMHGEIVHLNETLAGFRVHPGSQTYGTVNPSRAEEPVAIVTAILADRQFPDSARDIRTLALANAQLFSAQLHLRAGRFVDGWKKLRAAHALSAQSIFSGRGLRVIANALLNRIGHRLLWSARRLLRFGTTPHR